MSKFRPLLPSAPGVSAALCGVFWLAACGGGSDAPANGGAGSAGAATAGSGGASGGSAAMVSAGAPSAGAASAGAGVGGVGGASVGGGAGTSGAGASSAGSAGASGSAGSGGAAGGSAGAGGAMTSCVTAGNELCDDFESGSIDTKKWTMPKPSSTATVSMDTAHAHSGKYALHIHGVAGQINNGVIAEAVTFPAKNNSFYARIFAYFYPDLPAMMGGDFHTGFIVGTGKNDLGDVQAAMGLIGGARQFVGYSIFFGAPSYEFGPWANVMAAPNVWTCMELHEDGSDSTTEKRQVWIDDVERKELASDSAVAGGTAHPNHKPPAFDKVSVGLWEFHPSPTLTDMWVDDVRVSSQKIGCKN